MKRRYRKTIRAAKEAESRRKILEAATDRLSAVPLGHVTLGDIARRAGLTVQTVLRIYGSKERLFGRAASAIAREAMRRRDEMAAGPRHQALEQLAEAYDRWGEATERLMGQAEHVPGFAAVVAELRRHHRRWVRRLFGRELGRLPTTWQSEALGQLVVALDLATYRRLRGEGLSRAAATDAMRRLAASSFRRRL